MMPISRKRCSHKTVRQPLCQPILLAAVLKRENLAPRKSFGSETTQKKQTSAAQVSQCAYIAKPDVTEFQNILSASRNASTVIRNSPSPAQVFP